MLTRCTLKRKINLLKLNRLKYRNLLKIRIRMHMYITTQQVLKRVKKVIIYINDVEKNPTC